MGKVSKKLKSPPFHIAKRGETTWYYGIIIRAVAILSALIISGIFITVVTGKNPLIVYTTMFDGVFGHIDRVWDMLHKTAILLGISLAVTPAFKMRFWNIGAEGQVLIGGLATVMVMLFLGDKMPLPLLILVMTCASVIAGIIWAFIPAFFKAMWNTNETLFTLMMNYVAIQLVAWFLKFFVKSGSGVLTPMHEYGLPVLFGNEQLLNIIIVVVVTVALYIYLKYSKQGYEISVVGESENTAKYIGINVKKVIIRTLIISGAICGLMGLLLVGGSTHTINTEVVGGRGFTAIMVSWLAKFHPIYMILTAFLIVFLEMGASQLNMVIGISSSISDIMTGIILFFIIGCEFFLRYKIVRTKCSKEEVK